MGRHACVTPSTVFNMNAPRLSRENIADLRPLNPRYDFAPNGCGFHGTVGDGPALGGRSIVACDLQHPCLDVDRQGIQRHRPHARTLGTLCGDDGAAFHDKARAHVMTLGTLKRQRTAGVRHETATFAAARRAAQFAHRHTRATTRDRRRDIPCIPRRACSRSPSASRTRGTDDPASARSSFGTFVWCLSSMGFRRSCESTLPSTDHRRRQGSPLFRDPGFVG